MYIDKPAPESPAGLWGVPRAGGEPQLITERLGLFSPDMRLVAFPENRQTIVESLADGTRWTIPSEGRAVSFSPDGSQVAWTAGPPGQSFEPTPREVWVSRADGGEARAIFQAYGGGFSGWLSDGRILASGRSEPAAEKQSLWAVSPTGGEVVELAQVSRTRGLLISPGGDWLVYAVVFDPDPAQNGLWLVHTGTGERFRLDRFGAFRWRDAHRLLVIPLDVSQAQHRLWEVDTRRPAESLAQAAPLTDPATTPFRIANGDWSVSPDGRSVVFVSAGDHNLWVLDLPGE
jgi:Tol biopolymer transport system component